MRTQTRQQIIEIIKEKGAARAKDLALAVGVSPQALHRHLAKLVANDILTKTGTPPTVFYSIHASVKDLR